MTKYHPILVTLHWVLAILILGSLFIGGEILSETKSTDPAKLNLLAIHLGVGLSILGLMLVRLVVRAITQKPPHADIGNPLLNRAGNWTHWILYGLVIAMSASGIGISLAAGLPDIVFGQSGAPLPEDFNVFTARSVHSAISSVLAVIVVAHIAAALYHQFFRKDGLFGRMWFGKRS